MSLQVPYAGYINFFANYPGINKVSDNLFLLSALPLNDVKRLLCIVYYKGIFGIPLFWSVGVTTEAACSDH